MVVVSTKVNLDALIPREDFEFKDGQKGSGKNTQTLSINELKEKSLTFSALRKPDFQRETNEWDAEKICSLVESFINEELIPAVILWRSAGSYIFVIDGSHRISALASWVNDDYGDGIISKRFYDGRIPDEQIKIAEKTRALIKKRIGLFTDYELGATNPDKVSPEIQEKAKGLGFIALQLQWVEGDSATAESSFFKINQKAAPIDPTEIKLLKARNKPIGLAARAIIRGGKGHKYWSKFLDERQQKIQELAEDIHKILFTPSLTNPIKTLDLPIGGKPFSASTLPLILDFVNIVNEDLIKKDLKDEDDADGNETIKFLTNCRKVAQRINSNHPGSLGLHPVVYFYSRDGRHKIASFFAITSLIMEFNKKNTYSEFIKVRKQFEELLIQYDYLIQQIVRKYRGAFPSHTYIKTFYVTCINKLVEGKTPSEVVNELINTTEFIYLTQAVAENETAATKSFSDEIKSAAFIREALNSTLRCSICGGYMHKNSITIDHIIRKQDGGSGACDNAQLAHPYCNSTVKN